VSTATGIVERLRAAFAADDRGPAAGETCPDPSALWEAQHESGDRVRARRIVEHIARCPACAADWRLAMPDGARPGRVDLESAATPRSARRRLVAGLAGAAALAAGLGIAAVLVPWRATPTAPPFRSPRGPVIESMIPENQALPRDAFVLRWTSIAPGARYSVLVRLPTLESVASARGLDGPEFQVPESALSGFPAGQAIVWRVEATLPDGGRVSSPAFVHRIE